MALKKQATPKRWRSKEAKEIVIAVRLARDLPPGQEQPPGISSV